MVSSIKLISRLLVMAAMNNKVVFHASPSSEILLTPARLFVVLACDRQRFVTHAKIRSW
jgi:hypothetical protein